MKNKKDLLIRLAESQSSTYPQEPIVLLDGFEDAILGVCRDADMQRAIYSYWKCIEIMVHQEDVEFDEALEWMELVEEEDFGPSGPLFLKEI